MTSLVRDPEDQARRLRSHARISGATLARHGAKRDPRSWPESMAAHRIAFGSHPGHDLYPHRNGIGGSHHRFATWSTACGAMAQAAGDRVGADACGGGTGARSRRFAAAEVPASAGGGAAAGRGGSAASAAVRHGRSDFCGLALSRDIGRWLASEFGDAGLELLDLLSHRCQIVRHRLDQLRRSRAAAAAAGATPCGGWAGAAGCDDA